jgi:hypothetical protein
LVQALQHILEKASECVARRFNSLQSPAEHGQDIRDGFLLGFILPENRDDANRFPWLTCGIVCVVVCVMVCVVVCVDLKP